MVLEPLPEEDSATVSPAGEALAAGTGPAADAWTAPDPSPAPAPAQPAD
ncbi:MAG: hypothetical protein H6Q77_2784 [Gemmatimonadetes bacterium]|nr:hypothetical protein [Gemmatimonadota bacterium]